jgi:hypothetical protein
MIISECVSFSFHFSTASSVADIFKKAKAVYSILSVYFPFSFEINYELYIVFRAIQLIDW